MASRYAVNPRSGVGERVPTAHRDDLTGLDKVAALLEDLLDKQTELWRWNVGPYVFKRSIVNTVTPIASQAELYLARFTNPIKRGGSLIVGQFGISSASAIVINLTVDDQTISIAGQDTVDGDVTEPYIPVILFSVRDPVHTFASGAVAPLFNFVINVGDTRGFFWRNNASLSVQNISGSAINLYKSEFSTKLYSE